MKTLTPAEQAAEIASLKPTGQTVDHWGKRYEVFTVPTDQPSSADMPYVLRHRRELYDDQWFGLIRCEQDRTKLFAVGLYGQSFRIVDGWFTDAAGTLASV